MQIYSVVNITQRNALMKSGIGSHLEIYQKKKHLRCDSEKQIVDFKNQMILVQIDSVACILNYLATIAQHQIM